MKTTIFSPRNATLMLCMVCATSFSVFAQDLSKEITADHEVVPELSPATRLNIFPGALKPDFSPVELAPSTNSTIAAYTPITARFQPTWSGRAAALTPYRGYVDVGYFPVTDFGVSAGYSPVSTEKTELDIWLNALNNSYKSASPATEIFPQNGLDGNFRQFGISGGVNFTTRFNKGDLSVSGTVDYSTYNRAIPVKDQSVFGWDLTAGWHGGASNGLDYTIGAKFDSFSFGHPSEAQRQNVISVDFDASLPAGAPGRAGMDLGVDVVDSRYFDAFSIVSLTPYYHYAKGFVSGHAGVKLNLGIGKYGGSFHVAPDVAVGVDPSVFFGARLRLSGGEQLNTLRSLWQISRFVSPMFRYNPSNIPISAELALHSTPVGGITVEIGGAYGKATDWLLPMWRSYGDDYYGIFSYHNLHSFKAFARVNGAWRNIVDFNAEVAFRFGDKYDVETFWYEWRDGARTVITASAAFHPIEKLDITVGYEGRLERMLLYMEENRGKELHDLSLGAGYRVTPALTVFVRFDNLLCRRNTRFFLDPGPGLNGLFGVGYKF